MKWLAALLSHLVGALVSLLLVASLVAFAGWALLHNAVTTRWLLPMVPGIKVVAPQGGLLGDFQAQRVEIGLPRGGHVWLDDVSWRGLQVWPNALVPWFITVKADEARARRVDVKWVGKPASPKDKPLSDVAIPLAVAVKHVHVDEAVSPWWGEWPLTQLDATIDLQAHEGLAALHKALVQQVVWQGWKLSGQGQIGTSGAMQVKLQLTGDSGASMGALGSLHAQAEVDGPLKRLHVLGRLDEGDVSAHADGPAPSARLAQALLLDADVAPLDAWPLPRLRATAQALNLADLPGGLPRTRLQGDVDVLPQGQQDLLVKLDLSNAVPGAWDEQRLPVQRAQGSVTLLGLRAANTSDAAFQQGLLDLSVLVPSVRQAPAGRVELAGGWGGHQGLHMRWQGVMPQALHHAAPPLQLQGSLQLKPAWRSRPARPAPMSPMPCCNGVARPPGRSKATWPCTISTPRCGCPGPLPLTA